MKPAHRMLLQWYMPLVRELTNEQQRLKRVSSSRFPHGPYFLLLSPEKLAVIATHECLGMILAAAEGIYCVTGKFIILNIEGVKFTRAALKVGQAVRAEINVLRMKKDKSLRHMLSSMPRHGMCWLSLTRYFILSVCRHCASCNTNV